jgi:hypothetical protein
VKPFRRPTLHPPAGCVALTARGKRCGRPHFTEVPIIFEWDPIRGRGTSGPSACFCRMHSYMAFGQDAERFEIVGGWIGRAWNPDAEVWTVMVTVYEARDGLYASPHWWALRRETVFGDCSRVTYDRAVARCG